MINRILRFMAVGLLATAGLVAHADAQTPATVGLGTASSFAVLAGTTVTNTGPSTINGDLGVSPGNAVTGFPPGTVNGTIHAGNATAAQAQNDTTTAYNDAAGRAPTATVAAQLGGQTFTAGVYRAATMDLTGTVTLDAQGDPSAVFIFQAGSTLITASASNVALVNGANACNVFWQVGSSATLGTNSSFSGTILALTSITANTGANISGRLLARNGATTLDTNNVTVCAAAPPPATTTTTAAPGATTTTTAAPGGPTTTAAPGTTPPTGPPGATTSTTLSPGATTPTTAAPGTTGPPGATTTTLATGGGGTTNGSGGPTGGAGRSPRTELPRTGGAVFGAVFQTGMVLLLGGSGLTLVRPSGEHYGTRRRLPIARPAGRHYR